MKKITAAILFAEMAIFLLLFFCLLFQDRDRVLICAAPGRAETEKKKIAITFDDGPHPFYTEQLLDGLKERGVKATFFITGENAAAYPTGEAYERGRASDRKSYVSPCAADKGE